MKRAWETVAVICALLSVGTMGIQLNSLHAKQRKLHERLAYRDLVGDQVQRYIRLTSEQQDTLYGAKPQADIERRMGEALRLSGIVPAPAYAVSVQSNQALRMRALNGVAGLREQHVSVRLPDLPLESIGALLDHWQREQRIWAPERIELSHDSRSKSNVYALNLDCVAVYRADEIEE